jgi:hypothetical protein
MVTIKAVTVRGRMREAAKGSRGSDPVHQGSSRP